MALTSINPFPVVPSERFPLRDADDLRQRLQVYTRVLTALRNSSPRVESQITCLEAEVDAIRRLLDWRVL